MPAQLSRFGLRAVGGPMLACLALLALVAGCAPPARGAAGSRPELLVLSAGDATLRLLAPDGGGGGGAVAHAGPGPWRLAQGAAASAVVLSSAGQHAGTLTAIARSGASWTSRPVDLEPGALASHVSGDGRHAVAAYRVRASGAGRSGRAQEACRVAVIDPLQGLARVAHAVCEPGESVISLAVGTGRGGEAVAYLGLWPDSTPDSPNPSRRGRIVAVEAATGVMVGAAPMQEAAALLAVARAGPGAPGRLLCACGSPDADRLGREDLHATATDWRLIELDAESLTPLAVHRLAARPTALEAAPDGGAAYLLTGGLDVGARAALVHVELGSGGSGARALSALPGRAAGLAAGGEHVYVPHLDGNGVWVVDRARGRVVRTIPTGPRPIDIALTFAALAQP